MTPQKTWYRAISRNNKPEVSHSLISNYTNNTSYSSQNSTVQLSSVAQLCPTLRPHGLQHDRLPCPSPTPEFIQTHVHWVSDAIQPSRPLLLLPLILPSITVFSIESVFQIRWPKYWSFSFSISPSSEY